MYAKTRKKIRCVLAIVVVMFFTATGLVVAEWKHYSDEDLMAGTVRHFIICDAEIHRNALKTPALLIRKNGPDDYEVYIAWGGYTIDRDIISTWVRFGDAEPEEWYVRLSAGHKSTFFTHVDELLEKFTAVDTFTAEAKRATGIVMVARWDMKSFSQAFNELKQK